MYDEVFGAFIALYGSDFVALRGWGSVDGLESGLSGLGVVWQVQESLCSL